MHLALLTERVCLWQIVGLNAQPKGPLLMLWTASLLASRCVTLRLLLPAFYREQWVYAAFGLL